MPAEKKDPELEAELDKYYESKGISPEQQCVMRLHDWDFSYSPKDAKCLRCGKKKAKNNGIGERYWSFRENRSRATF